MNTAQNLFIRSLSVDWSEVEEGSYLRSIPALKDLDILRFRKNITFFVGENGSGKSTLLEAVASSYGFNAEGGTRNYNFSTYNDLSGLAGAIRLTRGTVRPGAGYFFRAESFFNVATAIMEKYNDDGQMPDYHKVSHGESFLDFMSRPSRPGIYLMDEPEAALSPQRQLTLLIHIVRMAEAGSQFVIVSHSPILLGIPDAEILEFSDAGIRSCGYEETESFRVTKLFIENRQRMLDMLLHPGEEESP